MGNKNVELSMGKTNLINQQVRKVDKSKVVKTLRFTQSFFIKNFFRLLRIFSILYKKTKKLKTIQYLEHHKVKDIKIP